VADPLLSNTVVCDTCMYMHSILVKFSAMSFESSAPLVLSNFYFKAPTLVNF
jgi:hypothetical protein